MNILVHTFNPYVTETCTIHACIKPSISSSVFQYTPIISPNEFQYVHHLLVYLCDNLNATDVGASAPCGAAVGATVSQCLTGELIAAWAVGGDVCNTACVYN